MSNTKLKPGRRKSILNVNTTVMAIPEPIIKLLDSMINGWDINNRTDAIKIMFKEYPKEHIQKIIQNNEKNYLVALSKGEHDELMKIKNSFPNMKFEELLQISYKNITRGKDEDVITPNVNPLNPIMDELGWLINPKEEKLNEAELRSRFMNIKTRVEMGNKFTDEEVKEFRRLKIEKRNAQASTKQETIICECGHEEPAHVPEGCMIDECTCGQFKERE